MNRPAASEILHDKESTYSLVIAVAKRARDIAIDSESSGTILSEKPVKLAVEEFHKGKFRLTESPEVFK